ELIRSSGAAPTVIVKGFEAAAAAAVPLRSHGIVIGTLIITDPREGVFVPEDIRLLSTLATHAAVVIANARFFEMVRRAKEQWETAFDALSEGIAVVDDEGRVRRSNRALASLLNMPLQNVVGTSLAGLSEFLLEQKELGKKDRGHLQVIQEQAERASRIVRNLLTFARKGGGERVPVDLNDVIRRTLSLTAYDLKLKDIVVERELSGALPDVFGDRHGLQQAVLNLVTNAAHA